MKRASQIATARSTGGPDVVAVAIEEMAPTEKTMEPPIGWPSAEIARQLSVCVPWESGGSGDEIVVFFAMTPAASLPRPSG